ncbi:MAG TPA: SRPBCC domain-containing protein [Candidatus Limnocylindrales bacterium]|nr:SRPBCC domain-containing protein [Candidatus Limnocylindrales bacterium]
MSDRAEQQLEVDAPREAVFDLLATADGLRRWLDAADLDPRVGGELRLVMREAEAVGKILALDPPQHISFTWQWTSEPGAAPGVVAFDAIDHGARTHVTVRHVGLVTAAQVELHNELWRYWLERLAVATRALPDKIETTHP